ncbi:hypothetical protein [Streptomyces zhihengii]
MTEETRVLHPSRQELISDLSGIVNDYPYADPEPTLVGLAADAADAIGRDGTPEARRERAGYTILLHATSWYLASRIHSASLFEAYIRALDGLRSGPAGASCACADGAHLERLGGEYQVEAGVSMLTRAGWAEFTEDYDLDEEDSAAFTCERLLADLADEAVGELSAARNQTFGDIDVSHLDAQFVREDGSLDIVAAQESIRRTWEDNTGPVALWSARRLLSGRVRDDERIGLHLCLWMGVAQSYAGLPPSYTRDIAAALATVDLDVACAHPRHPWSSVPSKTKARYSAVVHLYAPDDHPDTPVPAELSDRGLWECPVQYAELTRKVLDDLRKWRTMRGVDGED